MVKIIQKKTADGLKVIYVKNPNLSGVVVTFFIMGGSAFEAKKEHGMAHLVEHLIFAGNKNIRNHFPLNLELDAITRKDLTFFEISQHKDYLADIIKILFSAVLGNKFSENELETQKSVILQEIHERDEDPFVLLSEELEKRMYGGEFWSKNVLGTKESLELIDLENAEKWKRDFYQPNNMTLAISGNFEEEEIQKIVEGESAKYFGDKKGILKTLSNIEYNKILNQRIETEKFDQVYLGLAFVSSNVKGKIGESEYFKMLLLADVLGRKLQFEMKDTGYFYDVELYFHHYLNGGELRAITSVEKDKEEKATVQLLQKIESLEVSRDFFEKIKDISAKNFLLRADNVDDLSSLPLYDLAGNGKIFSPEEESKKISKISYDEIIELKNQVLVQENCNVVRLS